LHISLMVLLRYQVPRLRFSLGGILPPVFSLHSQANLLWAAWLLATGSWLQGFNLHWRGGPNRFACHPVTYSMLPYPTLPTALMRP